MPHLHICCPGGQAFPGLLAVVQEFIADHSQTVLGDDWTVSTTLYDDRGHLDARAYTGAVASRPGPTLFLRPVQSNALADITFRLQERHLAVPADVYDLPTLIVAIIDLRAHYDLGEPLVPFQRAVALMVVAKLYNEHMWGGKNKGYMWEEWIPKGRGIDEQYHPHVRNALFILRQHDMLISKVSNGKQKFALNPNRRNEIGDILRHRRFSQALERVFARGGATLPARELSFLDNFEVDDDSQ